MTEDSDALEVVGGRLDDAGLAAGERLAALVAIGRADERGITCVSQRAVAQAARVSLMTVGSALRKMRACGLARQLAAHVPPKGRPARWSFRPMFGKCAHRGRS